MRLGVNHRFLLILFYINREHFQLHFLHILAGAFCVMTCADTDVLLFLNRYVGSDKRRQIALRRRTLSEANQGDGALVAWNTMDPKRDTA